jgi:hypothetical protein
MEVTALPGGDLVEAGRRDLASGVESIPAPLEKEDSDAAHSRYNALVRRLVSFERAAECARG